MNAVIRDVFRVALTYARTISLYEETVMIKYKERRDRTLANLPSERPGVHAPLPPACAAARLFGLWHPSQRQNAARVRQMLQLQAPPKLDLPLEFVVPPIEPPGAQPTPSIEPLICPHCQGRLIFIRTLRHDRPWHHNPPRTHLRAYSSDQVARRSGNDPGASGSR
jgi:hypothetical protein